MTNPPGRRAGLNLKENDLKKLGSQLTTGDVVNFLPGSLNGPGLVARLLIVREDGASPAERTMSVIDLDNPRNDRDIRYFQHDKEYGVEDRGDVTADELMLLVEAADKLVKLHDDNEVLMRPDHRALLGAIVERLAPVVPPTLHEMLGALDVLVATPDLGRAAACDILNRARRAGML